jgi:predicted small integral membrane protein
MYSFEFTRGERLFLENTINALFRVRITRGERLFLENSIDLFFRIQNSTSLVFSK